MPGKMPQEPLRPYPYIEKEVTIQNPSDGMILHGTLTLPDEKKEYPAIILVTGSGAQDRDEEILGHKPFLVIADYLTRKGIAVLRCDDRHFKMPVKQGWQYTTMDFAGDAKATLDFLYNHPNINKSFIGILGHSEGGVVAPIVASSDKRVSFIVNLAGPGLSGYQIACIQGKDFAGNEKEAEFNKRALEVIISENDIAERKRNITEINRSVYGRFHILSKIRLRFSIDMIVSEWNRFFISFDPSEVWKKVTCPVLTLIGEYDRQVKPDENLNAIRDALQYAGNEDVTLMKVPKHNHLFQEIETNDFKGYTSMIREYKSTQMTISPYVLETIADWLNHWYKIKKANS